MRITLIGSGNVATHLGAAFKNAGHQLVQVYSRNIRNAALLAFYARAEPIDDLANLTSETDLLIIAVKDDAIAPIAQRLAKYQKLLIHTSGSTNLQVLLDYTPKAGVLYPLQTLSKSKEVDFSTAPICVEGADSIITGKLDELARTISKKVYRVDSDQRKILHLAAVFANNFPNYLYGIARELLAAHEMDFEMLRPLILETAQKVQDHLPDEVQTGPAVRNDESIMAAHLQMLNDQPQLKELYTLLSQGIIKMDNAGDGRK
jgi:predicted short-subunit dehydrogenase-like oxidoreductase (DUF2520 family)